MKTIFYIIITILSYETFSQTGIGPSNVIIPTGKPQAGVIDGVYEKKDVLAKKRPIPYDYVRENDYVWGKRTWSYIDLRERINHPLYYPHEKYDPTSGEISAMPQGRYSLFYILKCALLNGSIMAYRDKLSPTLNQRVKGLIDREGGDDFSIPADRNYALPASQDTKYKSDLGDGMLGKNELKGGANGIREKQIGADFVYWKKGTSSTDYKVYDSKDVTGPYTLDPVNETLTAKDAEMVNGVPLKVEYALQDQTWYKSEEIVKYLLKEDWFFDKERSVMDVRIIGLAPVVKVHPDSTEKIAFWVYFPHVREVLKNYYAYDPKSTVGGHTFEQVFLKREFNAVIYKSSSLYDRQIEDYRFGVDALYESEKVKNEIRVLEHDVWNF